MALAAGRSVCVGGGADAPQRLVRREAEVTGEIVA